MQTGIFRTSFGAQLDVKVSSLLAIERVNRQFERRPAVVLRVRPEHLSATRELDGCDVRLGALCLPGARLGLVLARSAIDLSIGLFELGHPEAQSLARQSLETGRLPVALADGEHYLFIDTVLTPLARHVFEESQGRQPAPVEATFAAAAQVIKHLKALDSARDYVPEPKALRHIIVSLCTGES